MIRSGLTAVLVSVGVVAASCATGDSSSSRETDEPVPADEAESPEPVAGADPDAASNSLDTVVFDRLVRDGFIEFEADCLARRLTVVDLVSWEADELLAVFDDCQISFDRLLELQVRD